MPKSSKNMAVLGQLKLAGKPLSLPEILVLIDHSIPERTLRRYLLAGVTSGNINRTGKKRGTRYQYIDNLKLQQKSPAPLFLKTFSEAKRSAVLEQIRNLWTHTSTALEGNSLTLGDTHAILGLGLTVSGKPLREHQEILGHAKAIDLIYQSIRQPLSKELIYALHKAVQTSIINDIFKPMGAWKVEVNGTNAVTSKGEQLFIEYAHPLQVDRLMNEVIQYINHTDISNITAKNATKYYAKVHMAIAHIHPFWDGNGRIARLLANILLLKSGLPPLVIDQSKRRKYIECLADYQVKVGKLTKDTGVWPDESQLEDFDIFCQEAYGLTLKLIE
jgi:Fic family protein